MKKLSELKSLKKFPSCERKLIGDLLVELKAAEPDKKEEPKYKVGDLWRFAMGGGGKVKIKRLDDDSLYGDFVYDNGRVSKDGYEFTNSNNLTERLWRDPS